MTSVPPRLVVLAAVFYWLGTAQAAGMLPGTGYSAEQMAPVHAQAVLRSLPIAPADLGWGRPGMAPRTTALGHGPLQALADAWNKGLASNQRALPGLHAIATAKLRQRFVDAPDADLFFTVEQACLAVGCLTEFAHSDRAPEPEYATQVAAAPAIPANTVVPVPPSLFLFGSALGLLTWLRRRPG